jgi:ferredoxin
MTLKMLVDEALCAANGQCYAVAPELFQADAQGFCAQAGKGLLDVPEGLEDQARLGGSVCPEGAIRVIDDEG